MWPNGKVSAGHLHMAKCKTVTNENQMLATFTWQDDQALDPAADVDYFVPATNADCTYVPQSQAGKGIDVAVAVTKTSTTKSAK